MEEDMEILGAFLLIKDVRILSQEEFDDVKQVIERLVNRVNIIIDANEEISKENKGLHKEINERIELKIENEKIVDRDYISKDKIIKRIEEKMKYLFVDNSDVDEGRYEAYMNILNLLKE